MAEDRFFVRLRGKVTGPFSATQLQSLHTRGQFGRFHEVSQDQVNWVPAASVPALFPPEFPRRSSLIAVPPEPINAPDPGFGPDPEPSPMSGAAPLSRTVLEPNLSTSPEWYYLDRNDAQYGPVSLSDLQSLLDAGQVDAGTYACKPGLAEWMKLESFTELRCAPAARGGSPTSASRPGGLVGLLIGCIFAPIIGIGVTLVPGWLAYDGFQRSDTTAGWLYTILAGLVLLLTAVVTGMLAVGYRRRANQQRKASARN